MAKKCGSLLGTKFYPEENSIFSLTYLSYDHMNVWIKIQNFFSTVLGPAINQLNQRLCAFQGNGEHASKT